MKKLNLIGLKFGKLLVLKESVRRTNTGKVQWVCLCDCGNAVVSNGSHLINGHTKSCSCIQKEIAANMNNGTHMLSRTPTYRAWTGMKSRCYNPTMDSYKYYGGRGIVVCDEWLNSFETFIIDMGVRPTIKHSIDRIDNNGDYCKSNCRWATRIEQENNKRTNKIVEYNGRLLTLSDVSRITGVDYHLLHGRIHKLKWDINKAIETKSRNDK
jgi:hypothetical protein